MKVIVGLGNPGIKYINNRHNVGYMVIDAVKVRPSKLSSYKGLTLLKSDKFMNDSGKFVLAQFTKYYIPYTSLYVIHDDLDIPLGSFKIQFGKGPRGHNGILDIEEKLGTADFWRVRVGVENRKVSNAKNVSKVPKGEEYVLQDFTEEEKLVLNGVIKQICSQLAS